MNMYLGSSHNHSVRLALLAVLLALITGCGGVRSDTSSGTNGGSSRANSGSSSTLASPVNLDGGALTMIAGDTYTLDTSMLNSGSSGVTLSFSSSNSAVATIDTIGRVSALAAGDSTLTVTRADNGSILTFALTVSAAAAGGPVTMTSWVGASNTLVTYSDSGIGMHLFRSRDPFCDIANYTPCSNGQMSVLAGNTVTDTAAATTQSGFYVLQVGG